MWLVEKWKSQPFSRFCIIQKMILCTHSELGKCCSQVNMANQKCNVAWRILFRLSANVENAKWKWENSIEDSCKFRPMILQIEVQEIDVTKYWVIEFYLTTQEIWVRSTIRKNEWSQVVFIAQASPLSHISTIMMREMDRIQNALTPRAGTSMPPRDLSSPPRQKKISNGPKVDHPSVAESRVGTEERTELQEPKTPSTFKHFSETYPP